MRNRARKAFKSDPFKAGKDVLYQRSSVQLSVSQEELDAYRSEILCDRVRNDPLPPLEGLPDPPSIKVKFDASHLCEKKFNCLLQSRRNGSSPGPNCIPYKVYKKCPPLASYLFQTMVKVKQSGKVPINWRLAFEVFIPKVDNPDSSSIGDFRGISLLNVEGKLFFSMISERLVDHIIRKNHLVDTSVQKGCMEGIPGCWEHIATVWDAIQQAQHRNVSLASVWLDIASAYLSIPHQLIFLALRRYGVSHSWISLIKSYYDGLWSKSCSLEVQSSWQQHQRGTFTGCTLSIILFISGMNLILEYVMQVDFSGFVTSSQA